MKTRKMYHIEEALGVIWNMASKGEQSAARIRETLEKGVCGEVFDDLLAQGYLKPEGAGDAVLTPEGERLGRDITRRHRLAERLLADVVEVSGDELDKTACEFEHVISEDVTEAICTLLGHPRFCPHGSEIPAGPCCKRSEENIEAIVSSLDRMEVGEKARIAYIVTAEHPHLHKLLSLGIVPGAEVHLHQKSPSFIIMAGQTQIAFDREVAEHIYVRRK